MIGRAERILVLSCLHQFTDPRRVGDSISRMSQEERGAPSFSPAFGEGWEQAEDGFVPPLRGLDRFFTLPSTPPSAACWARLSRPYGAGIASKFRSPPPTAISRVEFSTDSESLALSEIEGRWAILFRAYGARDAVFRTVPGSPHRRAAFPRRRGAPNAQDPSQSLSHCYVTALTAELSR